MNQRTLSSLTTHEFELRLKTWASIARQVQADVQAMPGPGWKPVRERLRNAGLMLRAERLRRSAAA